MKKYAKHSLKDLNLYKIGPVRKATAPGNNQKNTFMTPIYVAMFGLKPFTKREITCPVDLRGPIIQNCKNNFKRKMKNDRREFRFQKNRNRNFNNP